MAAVIERLLKGFHKTCLKLVGSKVQIANLPPYEDVIKELEDLIVKKLLRKK